MKKLWNQYSYAIILIILTFSATIILSNQSASLDDNNFMMITVHEGESLWKISKKYENEHKLSSSDFVKWVEKTNKIDGGKIYPGDSIVIPVVMERVTVTEVASSAKN